MVAFVTALLLLVGTDGRSRAAAAQNRPAPYMQERAPTYHAIVFGNDLYKGVPGIPSARHDFTVMKSFFKTAGYNVWDWNNSGRFETVDEFYGYMTEARDAIQPGDVVVFYYSGHGFSYANQSWLVPLDYPSGKVDQQVLFQHAIALNGLLRGLAEKRVDYVIVILDACRASATFPFLNDTGGNRLSETRIPGFSVTGRSLLAWNIGVPTFDGGQAFGLDATDKPSLFTGVLLNALTKRTRLSELKTQLDISVDHLTSDGVIPQGALSPRFLNQADFNFNPKPDASLAAQQKRDWENTMAEPSRRSVSDFLMTNPGSQYSTVAWKYIDEHPSDPVDAGGASLTLAEAIDASFAEGQQTGKLIAIATSGFNVNFPRNSIGFAPPGAAVLSDATVFAENRNEISRAYEERYQTKGSKLQFDIDLIGQAGAIALNSGQVSRAKPSTSASRVVTFEKSASIRIGETVFDQASGKLFAEIGSDQDNFGLALGTWAGLDYKGAAQPSFNVLNRALREIIVSKSDLGGENVELSVGAITEEVRRSSKDLLWVSIAVDYKRTDLAEFQNRLDKAPDEPNRVSAELAMEVAARADRLALASARLRAQDARLQLIKAGVDGKRITMVGEAAQSIGDGVRLRFFGSR
ncbi:caspase family protein [Rhizobium leguminosarum]|uniref:caspase family protein n=1 Tax=Rhizobium leguminosarum TaxID=384 RepID=UPI001C93CB47|nr:caspase family protein [Rhizobium leguminosarum]MBY5533648.1 caspase family protein [Rhizobium leguminosarum]